MIDLNEFTDYYTDLFRLMKSYGIESLSDLDDLELDWVRCYSSRTHGWVPELYDYGKQLGPMVAKYCTETATTPAFFCSIRGISSNLEANTQVSERAKYACLFPRRVVFLSDRFAHWLDDGGIYTVPYSFLAQAIILKPLLLAGLAILSPRRVVVDMCGRTQQIWGWYQYMKDASAVEVSAVRESSGAFTSEMHRLHEYSSSYAIVTPHLHGVSLDRYVRLVQEEEDSFHLFDRAVSRLLKQGDGPVESITQAVEELSLATARLNILYREKRRTLDFEGVTSVIGAFVTAGTLLAPSEFGGLAAGVGGATAIQSLTWLRNRVSSRKSLRSDEFWFLWQSFSAARS
ncbi:hypothetical protein ACIQPP_41910 [Streptomyces violaceusniger]|uniref:hypothetical protein n=1 Tax=Streptomyces violaceusniger TaxID=68280 RepID=UPI0009C350EF|nr:hypothetical protein SHXM_05777 [Streptomyces hygroscopicus]